MAKRFENSGAGPSQRQLRVGELVRKELSEILLRESFHDPALSNAFLLIHQVRMSPDLKLATAYIGELNASQPQLKSRIKALNRHSKMLRSMLGQKLSMKFTPEIRFRIDESIEEATKIDQLLASDKVRRDVENIDYENNIHEEGSQA